MSAPAPVYFETPPQTYYSTYPPQQPIQYQPPPPQQPQPPMSGPIVYHAPSQPSPPPSGGIYPAPMSGGFYGGPTAPPPTQMIYQSPPPPTQQPQPPPTQIIYQPQPQPTQPQPPMSAPIVYQPQPQQQPQPPPSQRSSWFGGGDPYDGYHSTADCYAPIMFYPPVNTYNPQGQFAMAPTATEKGQSRPSTPSSAQAAPEKKTFYIGDLRGLDPIYNTVVSQRAFLFIDCIFRYLLMLSLSESWGGCGSSRTVEGDGRRCG